MTENPTAGRPPNKSRASELTIPYYEIHAFTSNVFGGNPAGVCLLPEWLPNESLQAIAQENNLSETAFIVGRHVGYDLRWFTPTVEVDLCGHATLASAFVLFNCGKTSETTLTFSTCSGELRVSQNRDLISLDFPSRLAMPIQEIPPLLKRGLGGQPVEVSKSRDYMAIFESAEEVRVLKPDFDLISQLDCVGIIATAPGQSVDFVSRFFAPAAGIPKDPVTGSAHCTLIPYWSKRRKKSALTAHQLSPRGGELWCEDRNERVVMSGRAVLYLSGVIVL